jgi:ATP-dependent DNA helicase DinG
LVRLLDGRTDTGSGRGDTDDAAHLELAAALAGLRDLHERIRRAGQDASRYAVELRCSQPTAAAITAGIAHDGLAQCWAETAGVWQAITPLTVR